jgi:MinD-like ATPase involved in chromosome partitioning or flagellar assembly
VDLPTYTNIWRIEKRLYKLYDFRLPMPLPVGLIGVFTAIVVPYVVILTVLGLSFGHTSFWLYVLPPGVLAWLATRPVLESKRLPELIASQLRYLGEPRTWCRLAPLAEKDEILVVARVWRRAAPAGVAALETAMLEPAAPDPAALESAALEPAALESAAAAGAPAVPAWAVLAAQRSAGGQAWPTTASQARGPVARRPGKPARLAAAEPSRSRIAEPSGSPAAEPSRSRAVQPSRSPAAEPPGPAARPARRAAAGLAGSPAVGSAAGRARAVPSAPAPTAAAPPAPAPAPASAPAQPPPPQPAGTAQPDSRQPALAQPDPVLPAPDRQQPSVTVTGDRPDGRPLRVVERALRGPAGGADGWHDRVVVVPGGHRPGRPDFQQRDRARAQLPVTGSRRIVVLGCTVGAGQTITTLMTGEVLARVRDEPVAVLDLNTGRGSLAERADSMPAVAAGRPPAGPDHLHHSPGPSRLAVITSEATGAAGQPDDADQDVAKVFEMLSARYALTLADPGASVVPRVLGIADQLVLVAPASQDAASAIAMTLEWLDAHGHADLARNCTTVINGISRQTLAHAEQAETVARGRCRAIVRVPWDDQLRNPAPERRPDGESVAPLAVGGGRMLGPGAVQAYTALAGVLVAGLATAPEPRQARI